MPNEVEQSQDPNHNVKSADLNQNQEESKREIIQGQTTQSVEEGKVGQTQTQDSNDPSRLTSSQSSGVTDDTEAEVLFVASSNASAISVNEHGTEHEEEEEENPNPIIWSRETIIFPEESLLKTTESGGRTITPSEAKTQLSTISSQKVSIVSESTTANKSMVEGLAEKESISKYPKPDWAFKEGCNPTTEDSCCRDPNSMHPQKINPECKGANLPYPSFEDNMRKRDYIKDILLNAEGKPDKIKESNKILEDPETTESLEFLKTHTQFQVAGRNEMKIPQAELHNAMNGLTNMHLAHEIAINHDFKLEVYNPPGNSIEARVREQMKKAYWDIFDQAISANNPNPAYALSVFREMKEMLLSLLLPHNRGIKQRIEAHLDETAINYEIEHDIFEFPKYTDFIITTLGQLCCPVRDRQIVELKQLAKPSDMFKEIMHVMEQMHLDMANFLIGQIRPTIINNCIEYERKKFAHFIEMEYKLNSDALRVTRPWILRHAIPDRPPLTVIGRAFAEVLNWEERDFPETLTLDWTRFAEFAEEARRASFSGAAVLSAFNCARTFFGEDDANLQPFQQGNHYLLKCFPLREALKIDLDRLITKEDCKSDEKLQHVMDLMAEQSVKVCNDFVQGILKRNMTEQENDIIRRSVKECSNEKNAVRGILIRRLQDYATSVVTQGKIESVDFPKTLMVIEEQAMKIAIELTRIALHNRAVFQNLYIAIINGEVPVPEFPNENNNYECDPSILKAISSLNAEPTETLHIKRPARNDKIHESLDQSGKFIPGKEDQKYTETTPEIEDIIDGIIENTEIEDDYDEYANLTEAETAKLLQQLQRNDSSAIKRQMRREEESAKRIEEKKNKIRKELRFQLKQEMGLPIFDKVTDDTPGLQMYCKLLRAYDKERKSGTIQPDDTAQAERRKKILLRSAVARVKQPNALMNHANPKSDNSEHPPK